MTSKGIYYFKVMPFGLKNAGLIYQHLMNLIFKDPIGDFMEVYVNDMIVKSLRANNHLKFLKALFDIMDKYQMKLTPVKYSFRVTSTKFLGYLIARQGIEAEPTQIKALDPITPRRTMKDVQRLMRKLATFSRLISRYLGRTK